MKRSVSALFSNYVIDGTRMDCTPAQMLEDCMASGPTANPDTSYDSIVDEIVDPVLKKTSYDTSGIPDYIEKIRTCGKRPVTDVIPFPRSYTARKIAAALLSVLWKKGHFTLEDLEMEAAWKWDCAPLGNMAAFFFSVEKASSYMFDLGIRLKDYTFDKVSGYSDVYFSVGMENTRDEDAEDEYDFFNEKETVEMRYRWISDEEKCGGKLVKDKTSWLVYIPFDTCDYRLGGSMLEKVAGQSGETAPEVQDPDYFMDCFEVVRELVEDGVVLSGASVGSGGLATAAASMCSEAGVCIDISGIERATGEKDVMKILFSEVPGALLQISDADYDYMDSQFLLQDIAYFTLGHPDRTDGSFSVMHGNSHSVSDILASLLQGQFPEEENQEDCF